MERPYVCLSFAQGLDGSIGGLSQERIAISGPESLAMTYGLRSRFDAILVGSGTIKADDPSLGLHGAPGKPPRPIVVDPSLSTPPGARVYSRRESRPVILCAPGSSPERMEEYRARGVEVVECEAPSFTAPRFGETARIEPAAILAALFGIGVASVMVEGGRAIIASFLRSRLVDELVITLAPRYFPGKGPWAGEGDIPAFNLTEAKWEVYGEDIVLSGKPLFQGLELDHEGLVLR
jgi:riboflavin-specific deaminase-like protein